ncbi:MAG: hypothetical protein M3R30_07835 [Candidatus Eremiobacteraeota bacterium]|nr:hypothetical protein [Candidatus Eremiobacteraeota bacterium]
MQSVTDLQRHPSPAGHPQPLAALGDAIYAGCWDTDSIYGIDATSWEKRAEFAAPGRPYGMAVLDGTIRVVVAVGDDDRYLYTLVPGKGFDLESKIALPDLSGSHLASDGTTLHLLQMGKRQIVTLDAGGAIVVEYPLPVRIAGIGFAGGKLYGIAGDEEFENLHLAAIDLSGTEVVVTDLAPLDDLARGLTHDGERWWTSYRDENDIVSFGV